MSTSILIIDDSADLLENTSELLELSGYKTLTASNGKAGLEILKQHKPDLILCDIMMPVLDGYGVLRALENIPEMASVPFVFLTAKTEKKDFRKGMDLGADDYLAKPFSGDDLLRVIASRIKKSNALKKSFSNNLEGLNDFIEAADHHGDLKLLIEDRKIKKFRKKDMIYMEGDSPGYVYFIVSGMVKVFKSNEMGKVFITDIKKEGDFFGYVALLENNTHNEFTMAIENTEIAMIPGDDFLKLLFSKKEVSSSFIKFISRSLAEAEEKLVKLAYDSARKRVAEALLYVSAKYESEGKNHIQFNLNRENISALAGVSPESVSRNLTDFKDEGLIETNEGSVTICNLKKLHEIKN